MDYLIDESQQRQIASRIDEAVKDVLEELPNHGSEEGLTPVLGHALMERSFRSDSLVVQFNYRQTNKITEEPSAGADGGFLVRVTNAKTSVQKAALFQAKLLKGDGPVRDLSLSKNDAARLLKQSTDMLGQTRESVIVFYTQSQIYVVDADRYRSATLDSIKNPLSDEHRLITLGTYLGRWMPRCTKGDLGTQINSRIEHLDGFKHGLTMSVIAGKASIKWKTVRP